MQPEARDAAYLWDMVDAARKVVDFTQGITFAEYLENQMLQYAVERAIEIIGEAANRISPAFHQAHPEVPWRKIVGQRKRMPASRQRSQGKRAALLVLP